MSFLSKDCYTYSTFNEVYGKAKYVDVCENGSFMGMEGEFTCHYRKYDGWGKVCDEGDCTETYGLALSPIQFFRMAQQIMAFCNREFGTNYDITFEIPQWVRPNFCDEQVNYNRRDYPKYLDTEFKVSFDKREKYDFSNGAKRWQDAIKLYEWKMTTKESTYGEHNKSYYIGLADGFNEYIQQGCRVPNTIQQGLDDFHAGYTERKFGKIDVSKMRITL